MKERACVYDIVYKGGVCYVGMTNNPKKRLENHRASGIAPEGAELFVHKWYETRQEARIEEAKRQDDLLPVHFPRKDKKEFIPFGVSSYSELRDLFKRWHPQMSDADLNEVVRLHRIASNTKGYIIASEARERLAKK